MALVELVVFAGWRPLSPLGPPALALILASAFWGASGAIGGASVMFAYLIFTLGATERFPHFFANPGIFAFLVVVVGAVATAAVLLRAQVLRAHAAALAAAHKENEMSALIEGRQWLASIIDNAPAQIGYIDTEQRFRFNNRTYELWLEKPKTEITGRTVLEVFGEEEYEKLKPHLERALRGGRATFHHEHWLHGELRHAQTSFVSDFDPRGQVRGCFVVAKDIGSVIDEQHAHAGIVTESLLLERLRRAIARSVRTGAPLALMHLDVEGFRPIADSIGAQAAEALLNAIAARLRGCVRTTDTVARVGADKFLVLVDGLKERADASRVAQKMQQTLREPIAAGGGEVRLTVNVGVVFPDGARAPEELVKRLPVAWQ